MTAQEIRERYFVAGSPVIVCRREPLPIGTYCETIEAEFDDGTVEIHKVRSQVLRAVTLDDFMATVKPEYRQNIEPIGCWYLYEVSVD